MAGPKSGQPQKRAKNSRLVHSLHALLRLLLLLLLLSLLLMKKAKNPFGTAIGEMS